MTAPSLRYQLPKKAIKTDCPQCGPKHRKTLSQYIDTRTDEPLPEGFGRCDRESNCGYHLSPYHKSASGLSYADEVYQRWKEDQYPVSRPVRSSAAPRQQTQRRADAENSPESPFLVHYNRPPVVSSPPSTLLTSKSGQVVDLPTYSLPDEVFRPTIGHYDRNQFARLLHRQFGECIADQLLHRFQIGTSSRWPGASVFWLIDEQYRARAGQLVLFADDWHRVRYVDHEGKTRVCISSVSHGLLRRYRQQQQPAPDWLTNYHENAPRWPILFGLHQLATAPADQPVAVVEAPKTAVLCTPYFPAFVWLAVGSLSYLNAERLSPLRNRRIMLFPDMSVGGKAFARWSRTADELRQQGFSITVSDYLEKLSDADQQRRDGFDLADFLLLQTPTVSTVDEQLANPGVILRPDESQLTRLPLTEVSDYPAEWDTPPLPNATPTIRPQTVHK